MKNIVLFLFLLVGVTGLAQKGSGFGIKGGLNYGSTGDLENDTQNTAEDPEAAIGFHAGVFGKLAIHRLHLRPEVVYTQIRSTYKETELKVQKIDVPLLVGFDVIGPLSVFAGPSLQYILDQDLKDFTLEKAEDEFTVGIQMGVGVNFDDFGIDLRYERGLSKNETEIRDIDENRVDSRSKQLILALSFKF